MSKVSVESIKEKIKRPHEITLEENSEEYIVQEIGKFVEIIEKEAKEEREELA
ncbi:hypothetical protein L6252_01175 [Candidatus Parcubacteria bacterium]|nr:hypothetical protein [Candidatus Parcubacteria bacterium]